MNEEQKAPQLVTNSELVANEVNRLKFKFNLTNAEALNAVMSALHFDAKMTALQINQQQHQERQKTLSEIGNLLFDVIKSNETY